MDAETPGGPAFLRTLGERPPAAIVIDLTRLPSQGRDFALLIWKRKSTRGIPLVFAGGNPAKVDRVKELLPDAVLTSWRQIGASLNKAKANPPTDPVFHESQFAAYAGRRLAEKLGIKAVSVVGLVAAPEGFSEELGGLPERAQVRAHATSECDLFIWFTPSRGELESKIHEMAALAEYGPVWIAWPEKAARMGTDLTQQQVREQGLAAGWVDYKICSMNRIRSGLLFARRKPG